VLCLLLTFEIAAVLKLLLLTSSAVIAIIKTSIIVISVISRIVKQLQTHRARVRAAVRH